MANSDMAITRTITPAQHAVLDYSVASLFFTLGARYRGTHDRASTLAFINGAMVLGVSLLTDYPGGVWRVLSFKTHRALDIVQAALTAFGPPLMGFGGDSEARVFYGQAASEVGVVAMTDWDATSTRA